MIMFTSCLKALTALPIFYELFRYEANHQNGVVAEHDFVLVSCFIFYVFEQVHQLPDVALRPEREVCEYQAI